MRKLFLALAAAAAIGFSAPAFAHDAGWPAPLRVAQADVKVKVRTTAHGRVVKKVVTRRVDRPHRHVRVRRVIVTKNRPVHHHGRHVVVVKKRVYR